MGSTNEISGKFYIGIKMDNLTFIVKEGFHRGLKQPIAGFKDFKIDKILQLCHYKYVRKLLLFVGFFPTTLVTLGTSLYLFIKLPQVNEVDVLLRQQAHQIKNQPLDYTAASFIPQVLGSFTEAIRSQDARPLIISNYLEQYNSPLTPYAEVFVEKADEYGLKYYQLPIAIAQQESNLGKKSPNNCHNAWGWGIHSEGTLCFPDWPTGIDAYIKGLTEKYGDILAIEDEDEMLFKLMKRYAPVSLKNANGSWAKGVKQFLDEMRY